jgi:hypothetical protein
LVAGVSAKLRKWHRRLGHLSFDLLSCFSGPCRHGKMVAASHFPMISVMTERPCELFHIDLVGPLVCARQVGNGMSL